MCLQVPPRDADFSRIVYLARRYLHTCVCSALYLMPSSWRRLPMQIPETPAPSTITWKSVGGEGRNGDVVRRRKRRMQRQASMSEVDVQPLRKKMRDCRNMF